MKKFMTKYILPVILISIAGTGFAQVIKSTKQDIIRVSGKTTDGQVNTMGIGADKSTTIVYSDGLGRPIQQAGVQASPAGKDIVSPIVYDNLGQRSKNYLPYVSTATFGSYESSAISDQHSYYKNGASDKVADDDSAFNQALFEHSPLHRLLKAGSVGSIYQPLSGGYYKTIVHGNNITADSVVIWAADGTSAGYYGNNALAYTDATDEQGIEVTTFTSIAGQTILKRQKDHSGFLDTYYIYNAAGMISYVITPKAVKLMKDASSWSRSVTGVDSLVFNYVYDGRGRVIEKTVPGGGTMSIVYDPLNRPVLMQDANLKVSNKWNYIKYDQAGRAISQGIYTDATNVGRSAMQTYVDGLASNYASAWYETRSTSTSLTGYYTDNIFPYGSNNTPLAYSYYDDYNINGTAYSYSSKGLTNELTAAPLMTNVRGMLVAVSTAPVGSGGISTWLTKVMFYDNRGRLVQTQSNNQIYTGAGLTDYSTQVPDFAGRITVSRVEKNVSLSGQTIVTSTYTYDNGGRPKIIDQTYSDGSHTSSLRVASYQYNELGQLVAKQLDSTNTGAYLQKVDYRYNIRGQLTSINNPTLSDDHTTTNTNDDSNDVFGMEILYDQAESGLNGAYHNGMVSAVKWMSVDGSGVPTPERAFNYVYDEPGRLIKSDYHEKSSGSWTNNNEYNEHLAYDKGGNITWLARTVKPISGSVTAADNLAYTYSSANPYRLLAVTDSSGNDAFGFKNLMSNTSNNYQYDPNGNMTRDPYKGLTISYNVLNRVDVLNLSYGSGGTLKYTYSSAGNLLRKDRYDTTPTLQDTYDYIDGFVYKNSTLQYFAAPEGRVRYTGSGFVNEYVITDQQGNARVTFDNSNTGGTVKVIQENSYYAFGLAIPSAVSLPTTPNKNLFNGGSEVQDDLGGLPDLMQTFYRNYDAAIGRWTGVDPEPESADDLSTYQYAGNNPIMMNDPMGNKLNENPPPVYNPETDPHGLEAMSREFERADAALEDWMRSVGDEGGGAPDGADGVTMNADGSIHITGTNNLNSIYDNLFNEYFGLNGNSILLKQVEVHYGDLNSYAAAAANIQAQISAPYIIQNGNKVNLSDIAQGAQSLYGTVVDTEVLQLNNSQVVRQYSKNTEAEFNKTSTALARGMGVAGGGVVGYGAGAAGAGLATGTGVGVAYAAYVELLAEHYADLAGKMESLRDAYNESGLTTGLFLISTTRSFSDENSMPHVSTSLNFYVPNGSIFKSIELNY